MAKDRKSKLFEKTNLSKTIAVRLTEDEVVDLKDYCNKNNITISKYFRYLFNQDEKFRK